MQNDFEDNPLTALMGELITLTNNTEPKFQKALKNAAILLKQIAPVIAQAFTTIILNQVKPLFPYFH